MTIGSFDGVHLGHQQLFKTLVEYARKHELQTAVITFWPLPPMFFKRVPERYALTSPEERAESVSYTHLTLPTN
jgi:riboflavin kinase/FMN adenylyltransferase